MTFDDANVPTVRVTGANRGLGLEFSRQYVAAETLSAASQDLRGGILNGADSLITRLTLSYQPCGA